MTITRLVLMRHGESQWNKENKFTGWHDVGLSEKGIRESKIAGKLLKDEGFFFDFAYTSMLKRAIHTLWNMLDILDQVWLPIEKSWKLNERHYGALQGMNKLEVAEKYGSETVQNWRRSFSITPPELTKNDKRYPGFDPRYAQLTEKELPLTESLALTFCRVVSYWNKSILPRLKNSNRIIIVAHGNSLRALIKYLNNMDEEDVFKLNIPTGTPIVYKFNENAKPVDYYYLDRFQRKSE